jgi:hypothetical protein
VVTDGSDIVRLSSGEKLRDGTVSCFQELRRIRSMVKGQR